MPVMAGGVTQGCDAGRAWRPTPTRRRSPPLMPFMPSVSSPISVCWHAARSCANDKQSVLGSLQGSATQEASCRPNVSSHSARTLRVTGSDTQQMLWRATQQLIPCRLRPEHVGVNL